MSYQGPDYDGTSLDEARNLKESTLRLFPDNENRQRIRRDLALAEEAQAQRDWEIVRYYEKKGKPRAVAIYSREVIERYPTTEYARLARRKLSDLGPEVTAQIPGFSVPPSARPRSPGDVRPGLDGEPPPRVADARPQSERPSDSSESKQKPQSPKVGDDEEKKEPRRLWFLRPISLRKLLGSGERNQPDDDEEKDADSFF